MTLSKLYLFILAFNMASVTQFTFANNITPTCTVRGKALEVNNKAISLWKRSTPNQYINRGHAEGKITQLYPNQRGHQHFAIRLNNTDDTLEIIYNTSFGKLPSLKVGMDVEACGDYITATRESGPYPASPDGAILHWVHVATHTSHESGYLELNDVVYGVR